MTECMHHAAGQCGLGYCGLGMQKENNDAGIKKTNKQKKSLHETHFQMESLPGFMH